MAFTSKTYFCPQFNDEIYHLCIIYIHIYIVISPFNILWDYSLNFDRGNGASVIRVVPYAALHFMTYEQYRRYIIDHYPSSAAPGPVVDLLAGSLAGGTAVLSTYPLDLARTTLAYQVIASPHWIKFF